LTFIDMRKIRKNTVEITILVSIKHKQ